MSTINHEAIARRLTRERLRSYLASTGGDLEQAIDLYDWNTQVGGALHEDIGRLEVVFRNAVDEALVVYGTAQGWPTVWYRRRQLFPGKHGARSIIGTSGGISTASHSSQAGSPPTSETGSSEQAERPT